MAGLASLVIAAGLLAAVGPVSAGADTPSQQFPPVDQPGVTSTQINVGGVVAKTNPLGGDYAAAFDGVQAYFNMVNASKDKGIYGRKLNLSSKRDDQVGMNRQEVQGLISEDNVFAVLPVSTLLFTGADLLGQSGIPTFGWNINAEWGSEQAPGPPNLFGEKGSYLCFTCASQTVPWLVQKLHKKKIGLLAYQVPQSADCAKGVQATFDKYPSAKVEFVDTSLAFGVTDLSNDVSQMKDKGVDMVTTCMDNNGTLTLAKEMKKQGLNAVQYLPDAYNQKFISDNAPFFQGSYALTFFTPFEVKQKPQGLKEFQTWMKKGGFAQNENSMAGWINATQFVQGLKEAGPDFTRQKVVDAINAEKNFTANGLLAGIDWSVQHMADQAQGCNVLSKVDNGKFVPSFGQPGKPFVCFQLNPLPDKLQSQPTVKG
ncbi:MAG TPA: ABC transporter substrate-binding protein [Acidimicrobiia bacterium]|nr:ABC transporter substrate-binding protein [Acidimicrobiia bacterium]